MNVEQLDGFFAALIAGPETVMPSEYYPEVFGGEMSDACQFESIDQANEILGLMMRHWSGIAGTLFKDEVYVPLLLFDEDGTAHGNDWAHGFMRGMGMRHDGWAELVNDEDRTGGTLEVVTLFPAPVNTRFRVRLIQCRVLECDFVLFRSTRTRTRSDTCPARIFR